MVRLHNHIRRHTKMPHTPGDKKGKVHAPQLVFCPNVRKKRQYLRDADAVMYDNEANSIKKTRASDGAIHSM